MINKTDSLAQIAQVMRAMHDGATPGLWCKGFSSHHTVSKREGREPYRIAEFRHAADAAFCDFAHANTIHILDALDVAQARIAELEAQLSARQCWCETCDTAANSGLRTRMSLCPTCGNKRCPRSNHHDNACTNSNAPGQKGSSWEHVKGASNE